MDLQSYRQTEGALTVAELAAKAHIRHTAQIRQWLNKRMKRYPGPKHAAGIEVATEGKCTCEELNPNLSWRRIPDPTWPWHPKGRPFVDGTTLVGGYLIGSKGAPPIPEVEEGQAA